MVMFFRHIRQAFQIKKMAGELAAQYSNGSIPHDIFETSRQRLLSEIKNFDAMLRVDFGDDIHVLDMITEIKDGLESLKRSNLENAPRESLKNLKDCDARCNDYNVTYD